MGCSPSSDSEHCGTSDRTLILLLLLLIVSPSPCETQPRLDSFCSRTPRSRRGVLAAVPPSPVCGTGLSGTGLSGTGPPVRSTGLSGTGPPSGSDPASHRVRSLTFLLLVMMMMMHLKTKMLFFLLRENNKVQTNMYRMLLELFYCFCFSDDHSGNGFQCFMCFDKLTLI